jgi:serine/threonine protein kinase/WD40 repeat protein
MVLAPRTLSRLEDERPQTWHHAPRSSPSPRDARPLETLEFSLPTEVGHYRVIRPLGRGGMGSVFLARDVRLGRLVVLKFLAQDLLDSRALRAQFDNEARATASLSHPNVVTLYDVGELLGRPWVALEYIEGMTLAQRLQQDWPSPPEAIRIGLAIARAIEAAHAAGIVHRDLKPANVVLGKDGRPRVVDFGLARFSARRPEIAAAPLGLGAASVVGTPTYMAPEQWEGRDGLPSDVWALGLILHLLFSRKQPLRDLDTQEIARRMSAPEPVEVSPELALAAPRVASLVTRCLTRNPAARPTASELVSALAALETEQRAPGSAERPFRGLSSFGEQHAHLFFGREDEVAACVERLRDAGTMVVAGTSGAGKSSFLFAGVVPRLREAGPLQVIVVRPQARPLLALAAAILGHGPQSEPGATPDRVTVIEGAQRRASLAARSASASEAGALEAELRAHPDVLALRLSQLFNAHGTRVLLVVDQLEEVVTVAADEAERRAFLDALGSAGAEPREPVRVIMTVRDDFLGRIPWGASASRILSSVLLLAPPEPDALREIVQRPLDAAGFAFDDPRLLDEIIDEVRGESARLPLLQFALSLLWARRDTASSRLLRADYERMGGVGGALASHAEDVMATLAPRDVELCRELLLRLVTQQGTRRARSRGSLLGGLGEGADALVTKLLDARLLAVQRGDDGLVELAHESLTRVWPRLSRWIEESREDIAIAADLVSAAERWERRGRSADDLWSGEALRDAARLLARGSTKVPEVAAALVRASQARERARATRRRLALTAIIGGALLAAIASTLAAWALRERQREALVAARRAEDARARLLEERALASAALGEHHDARAQLRAALEVRDSPGLRTLARKLSEEPALLRVPDGLLHDALIPAGGRSVVITRPAGTVELVDAVTLERRVLRGHTDPVLSVVELTDARLVSLSMKGELFLWEPAALRGKKLLERRGVRSLAAWGDLVAIPGEGKVELLDAKDPGLGPRQLATLPAPSFGAEFGPDGRTLFVAGEDGRLRAFDVGTGALLGVTEAGAPIRRIAASVARLFLSRKDGGVAAFALPSLEPLWEVKGHDGNVLGLAVTGSGRLFSIGSLDHRLVERSPVDGRELWEVPTRVRGGQQLRVSRDGELLVAAGGMGAEVWELARLTGERRIAPHAETVVDLRFSADGARLVSASNTAFIGWDVARGTPVSGLSRGDRFGLEFAVDEAAGHLVSADGPTGLALRDLASFRLVATLGTDLRLANVVDFDPSSGIAVVGTLDGGVFFVDPRARTVGRRLDVARSEVRGLVFERGGRRVFAASLDGEVFAVDRQTGRATMLYRHGGRLYGIAATRDGEALFLAGRDGRAVRFHVASRRAEPLLSAGTRLHRPACSPDGRIAVFPAADGRVYVVVEGQPTRSFEAQRGKVNVAVLDPSGRRVAVAGDDRTVGVFDVATGAPLWRAQPEDLTEDVGLTPVHEEPTVVAARQLPGLGRVVAYDHGAVELRPLDGSRARHLKDLPGAAVRLAIAGPPGILALGFDDGTFGLWEAEQGTALEKLRLHGPLVGLRIHGGELIGASALGDRAALGLSTLEADYCELLALVRLDIPYVWRDGEIVPETAALPCVRP